MVPDGWTETPLESLTSQKVTYGVVKPGDERTGGVPFVRGGDFPNGTIRISELRTISNEISDAYKRTLLRGGEILVSLVGYPGATAIVPNELAGANIARQAALVRPNERVDRDYLFQFLRSDIGQKRLLSQTIGSAQQVINLKDLNALHVACPPLPEQRKIADILSTWDQAIETTEALLATARTQKRALMQSLLTGKRRFPAFEGQEWKEVRLGDICDPKQWTTISAKNMTESGFPVYGANGHIGWFTEYNHQHETIAVGCRGVCGSVHLVPPKSYITGNSMALDDVRRDKAVVRFLFQYLTHFGFRDIVSGSAQPQITGKAIKAYKLKIPSVEEQRMIADVFDAADNEIRIINAKVAKLRTEKKALMQQLLTGKRRVLL